MTVQPLSRRSLLTGSVLTVAAGIVGYAVARNSDAASPTSPSTAANGYGPGSGGATVLAPLSQITGDGIVASGVVLTKDGSGTVHAVSATCTHQGCGVSAPQGGTVSCPCHGS